MTARKTRDSNMELLRLVAMLLIMMVHASYRALPKPTPGSIADDPLSALLQIGVESFTVVGVNVFVMLSGWYGIRLRWSRLLELLFQVVFFALLCLGAVCVATGSLPQGAAHQRKRLALAGLPDRAHLRARHLHQGAARGGHPLGRSRSLEAHFHKP
jgi:peptidoglycan/LPS O-acetylase OafA/YrhL